VHYLADQCTPRGSGLRSVSNGEINVAKNRLDFCLKGRLRPQQHIAYEVLVPTYCWPCIFQAENANLTMVGHFIDF